ncbi:hypothetical protein AC792_02835 [Arthrobacter sp. RIT-PI-e]|uniref:S1C family serine protease n=1 Tax=Arthrobacter sp. RIT-PI-e TaxID=1681197 RepID=UPI000676A353|nr:trypsin-like peptidase domain-containing protein [Arthrobacter sp. RIT-PI-e]KNC20078.1 hypothetical protein AC792_02835 [Arthrobacter sp. RIT-PI-e]
MNEQPEMGNPDRPLPPRPSPPPAWAAGPEDGAAPAEEPSAARARQGDRTGGYPDPVQHTDGGTPTGQFAGPQHGFQDPRAASHPAYSAHQPFYGGRPAGQADTGTTSRGRRKVGLATFAAGVLAAGLIGGVVGPAAVDALNGSSSGTISQAAPETVVVNNSDDVNAITGAAVTASPSVVTIAVSGDGSGGSGSGIILDTEGHILTNTHVVTLGGQVSDPTIEVKLNDGRVFAGTVVGTDPLSDLAVVKIDAPDLTAATLGNSDELNVGDSAIAIGAPLGLSGTVTDGIVSTLNRTISVASSAVPENAPDSAGDGGEGFNFLPPDQQGAQPSGGQGSIYLNVIQTDAAINQGNSGGALVDSSGHIIGVNVAIASGGSGESTGNIGVGFSIPINYAQRIAGEIIANGEATHGFLGVRVSAASGDGTQSRSTFSSGALVESVEPGSPAAAASLQAGDVITKVGTYTVDDPKSLTAAVRIQSPEQQVPIEIIRGGNTQTLEVTLSTAQL